MGIWRWIHIGYILTEMQVGILRKQRIEREKKKGKLQEHTETNWPKNILNYNQNTDGANINKKWFILS